MEATPLSRVDVGSEVGELKAVVVHTPGVAHRTILPEHVEAHLALKDLVLRRLRISEQELTGLRLANAGGHTIAIGHGDELQIAWQTADGRSGELPLGNLKRLYVENPQYILFDDIVDADRIEQEHHDLTRVLRTAAPRTLQLSEMLYDSLHRLYLDHKLRDEFFYRLATVSGPEEHANVRQSREYLEQHGERRFLQLLLSGRDHLGHYVMHPLPNLLFTRDLAAAVGRTLVLSSAAKPARRRESVLAWLVFTQHPLLADLAAAGELRHIDMQGARLGHPTPDRITVEGGDILHLGNGTLLVGVGERTTFEGVVEMAAQLWTDGATDSRIERIVVVEILDSRASMHLDTIFTLAWQQRETAEAMVFGPYMQDGGYGELTAWELTPADMANGARPGKADVRCWRHQKLDELLHEVAGLHMTPMFCGSRTHPTAAAGRWEDPENVFFGHLPDAINAKREQWTDGANLFALAPGIVLTYERNHHSLDAMARAGYRVVDVDAFCRNSRWYLQRALDHQPDARTVIALGGSELCRGRGGPRCMTLPLLREPLP